MRLVKAITLAAALSVVSCNPKTEPKFAHVASLLCEGLEDFEHLKSGVVTVHLLMERGDYPEALRVAYAILQSFDEFKDVAGANELRALIFLLESIVNQPPLKGPE